MIGDHILELCGELVFWRPLAAPTAFHVWRAPHWPWIPHPCPLVGWIRRVWCEFGMSASGVAHQTGTSGRLEDALYKLDLQLRLQDAWVLATGVELSDHSSKRAPAANPPPSPTAAAGDAQPETGSRQSSTIQLLTLARLGTPSSTAPGLRGRRARELLRFLCEVPATGPLARLWLGHHGLLGSWQNGLPPLESVFVPGRVASPWQAWHLNWLTELGADHRAAEQLAQTLVPGDGNLRVLLCDGPRGLVGPGWPDPSPCLVELRGLGVGDWTGRGQLDGRGPGVQAGTFLGGLAALVAALETHLANRTTNYLGRTSRCLVACWERFLRLTSSPGVGSGGGSGGLPEPTQGRDEPDSGGSYERHLARVIRTLRLASVPHFVFQVLRGALALQLDRDDGVAGRMQGVVRSGLLRLLVGGPLVAGRSTRGRSGALLALVRQLEGDLWVGSPGRSSVQPSSWLLQKRVRYDEKLRKVVWADHLDPDRTEPSNPRTAPPWLRPFGENPTTLGASTGTVGVAVVPTTLFGALLHPARLIPCAFLEDSGGSIGSVMGHTLGIISRRGVCIRTADLEAARVQVFGLGWPGIATGTDRGRQPADSGALKELGLSPLGWIGLSARQLAREAHEASERLAAEQTARLLSRVVVGAWPCPSPVAARAWGRSRIPSIRFAAESGRPGRNRGDVLLGGRSEFLPPGQTAWLLVTLAPQVASLARPDLAWDLFDLPTATAAPQWRGVPGGNGDTPAAGGAWTWRAFLECLAAGGAVQPAAFAPLRADDLELASGTLDLVEAYWNARGRPYAPSYRRLNPKLRDWSHQHAASVWPPVLALAQARALPYPFAVPGAWRTQRSAGASRCGGSGASSAWGWLGEPGRPDAAGLPGTAPRVPLDSGPRCLPGVVRWL